MGALRRFVKHAISACNRAGGPLPWQLRVNELKSLEKPRMFGIFYLYALRMFCVPTARALRSG
jgi:hypothetical protein